MRTSLRLLTARLPPLTPTGLAGLLTHPHPRPALIALYNHTLSILSSLPDHSVYRQSAENLTKRRLSIVSSIKPLGYDGFAASRKTAGLPEHVDIRDVALYMRSLLTPVSESTRPGIAQRYSEHELSHWSRIPWPESTAAVEPAPGSDPLEAAAPEHVEDRQVELEPQLSAEQVEEMETKIGEGLIEEVIEESWGELLCAEAMAEHRVWEPLLVVPEEGQWVAFERVPATGAGQG